MNKNWVRFARIFLIVNILLALSSIWFSYENFYLEIVIVSVFLILSLIVRKLSYFSIPFSLFFYGSFFYWNINYIFILGICLIVGLLIYNFIKPEMKINKAIYSLIAIFLLLHVIWWNVLPLGFSSDYSLDIGSLNDMDDTKELYVIDSDKILSPAQAYGDRSWRSFEKDGSIDIKLNTPVNLMNKTVEVSIEYESDSPIYINDELFYNPLWNNFILLNEFEDGNLFVDSSVLDEMCFSKFAKTENLEFNKKLINASFRGSVIFEGIFDEIIDISFIKSDRNWYDGNDTLLFQIIDMNDEVVFEQIIKDNDNLAKGAGTNENSSKGFNFNVDVEFGKYVISFKDLSSGSDISVSDFKINTNKFVLVNNFHLLNNVELYFDSNSNLDVQFWHANYDQNIILSSINGNEEVFSLLKEDIKKLQTIELSKYNKLNVNKGNLIFKNSDSSFTFWENGLIKDFDCDYNNDFGFNFNLEIEEFIDMNFDSSLDVFDSTKSLNVSNLNQNNFKKYYENFETFENVNYEKHTINSSFRGDICFEGYFDKSIEIGVLKQDLNMYEGAENVILNITSTDGNSIGAFSLPDDGNSNKSSNGEIQKFNFDLPINNKGFYNLCFKVINESSSDFEIMNISFNSNKILSKGFVYIRNPTKVYFNNLNKFKFRYYHKMNQDLIFNNGKIINIMYEKNLKSKWQEIDVSGLNSMNIEDGNLMFQGDNLYFGYWKDAIFKKSLNQKLVFTKSNNLNSTQSLNILIEELKLNLKSQKDIKLFNINIKNEK